MPNFPRIPVQSASEGRLSDFQIFEEVDRNQPPALRFLPTGISKFDKALGGGIPSNSVTSWRSPRTFAADAVLLEVCRTACARGERVRLVDASDRFGAAALQAAGLDTFTAQGLFERLHLATISEVAQLADAWRRGETGDAPGLLVVDSLVATVGASFLSQRSGKSKTPFSKMPRSKASDTPVFAPQAQNQGRIFCRLLVKLNAFARSCGAGMIIVESPIENIKIRPRYQSKRRRSDFLEHTAQNSLTEFARLELILETNSIATSVVRVVVAPNRFSRASGAALISVRV